MPNTHDLFSLILIPLSLNVFFPFSSFLFPSDFTACTKLLGEIEAKDFFFPV